MLATFKLIKKIKEFDSFDSLINGWFTYILVTVQGFVVWLDVPILRVLGLAELKLSMAMVEIL